MVMFKDCVFKMIVIFFHQTIITHLRSIKVNEASMSRQSLSSECSVCICQTSYKATNCLDRYYLTQMKCDGVKLPFNSSDVPGRTCKPSGMLFIDCLISNAMCRSLSHPGQPSSCKALCNGNNAKARRSQHTDILLTTDSSHR